MSLQEGQAMRASAGFTHKRACSGQMANDGHPSYFLGQASV